MLKDKVHIKHIELYIAGFLLAVGVAIFGITYALTHMSNMDAGYREIVALDKEDIPNYNLDFTFHYYFDGDGDTLDKYNQLRTYYSDELSLMYASLNEEQTYQSTTSIYTLSEKVGEEVTFDNKTYNILKDAYEKTLNGSNYSVFSEPIYSVWTRIYTLSTIQEKIERDPLNNENTKSILNSLAQYISNRNHIDFEFKDNNIVILKMSDEYKLFLEENALPPIYVGLNILKNSYLLDDVSSYLSSLGYGKGYFSTTDGLAVELKGNEQMSYGLYTPDYTDEGEDVYLIGKAALNNPSSLSSFHSFDLLSSRSSSYYTFKKDNILYYRSNYIDLSSGISNNIFKSVTIYNNDISVLESSYIANELMKFSTIEEVKSYIDNNEYSNLMVQIDLNNSTKSIYITKNLNNFVSLFEGLDYNLINF